MSNALALVLGFAHVGSKSLTRTSTSGPTLSTSSRSGRLFAPQCYGRDGSDSSDSDSEGGYMDEESPKRVRMMVSIAWIPTLFGDGNEKRRQIPSERASLLATSNSNMHLCL
jgi:hypothetical protein